MAQSATRAGQSKPSLFVIVLRCCILLLPVMLLVLAVFRVRAWGQSDTLLIAGAVFQVVATAFAFRDPKRWRQPMGTQAFVLYVIALAWLWFGLGPEMHDWFLNMAQALLLVVALGLFAERVLADSSARELHHAYLLAQRLLDRRDWPENLHDCRNLPEVRAFREAVAHDPQPAFALLVNERPQVRMAALTALEFRRDWRPGQPELILNVAQNAAEPEVRSAAIAALANLEERMMIERLGEFLSDPALEVRRAAAEVLLWDSERRWPWIRHLVRRNLADAAFKDDGPLLLQGQMLTDEAVKDLNAWVAEKGRLSIRSVLTLMIHYERVLNETGDEKLLKELKQQMLESKAPAILRIEIAQLLQNLQLLPRELQERLLDPMNPAPLRIIAADGLLADARHAGAVTAMRDVARMPNREIALATADVVQRRLNLDMGLAPGQPLPDLSSREATEVTRRVMTWSRKNDSVLEPAKTAPILH